MSWQSIPHYIIYTFFVQFKIFFSEQYFTKTASHSISMSHIVYFPNISSNNLLCSFFTITLATLWIKSSPEQLWKEVGQLLFSSLEKMGMDWYGVDHCDECICVERFLSLLSTRLSWVCAEVLVRQVKGEPVNHLALAGREWFTSPSVYGAHGYQNKSQVAKCTQYHCILTQISFIWLLWQKPAQPILRKQDCFLHLDVFWE